MGLRVSVTERTVRRWESDSPPWPRPAHQAALESLLRRPLTDLGFTPRTRDAAAPHPERTMNRRAFISMAAAFGAAAMTQLTSCGVTTGRSAVTYAFTDDFDGPARSAPDPSKWRYDIGDGWGNNELQAYTSSRENSFQDGNGNLVIRATKSVQTFGGQIITAYRSARLNTLGKFSKYHGTFEARIKLDIQRGLWPVWWMIGANFPKVGWPACGEVDMLENYGDSIVVTSVHTPDNAGTDVLSKHATVPVDDGWHTWRTWWDPGSGGFTFYKDGMEYLTVEPAQLANWCFSSKAPMSMILNLAIGGAAGNPPDSVQFPIDMLVDYVRVW
ncbi:MAG TPA: glycoside hydrolase family 16 protein [Trebonia sp.]